MPATIARLPARSTLCLCVLLALAMPAMAQEPSLADPAAAPGQAPDSPDAPPDRARVHDATTFRLDAVQMEQLPLQRDLLSAAALAPDAVFGDPAFGHNVSFGGGAVSENRVSVNGFDITNSYKGLDVFRVPRSASGSWRSVTPASKALLPRLRRAAMFAPVARPTDASRPPWDTLTLPRASNGTRNRSRPL